jgi:hypothetical protein
MPFGSVAANGPGKRRWRACSAAERLGVRVIHVDGSCDAEEIADIVAGHFEPFL